MKNVSWFVVLAFGLLIFALNGIPALKQEMDLGELSNERYGEVNSGMYSLDDSARLNIVDGHQIVGMIQQSLGKDNKINLVEQNREYSGISLSEYQSQYTLVIDGKLVDKNYILKDTYSDIAANAYNLTYGTTTEGKVLIYANKN